MTTELNLDQMESLLTRARKAQKVWVNLGFYKRGQRLLKVAQDITENIDEYAEIIAKDNGKPQIEAVSNDLLPVIHLIHYYVKNAEKILQDKPIKMTLLPYKKSIKTYEPLGVVGIISPWNFPFSIPMGDVICSLVAGNAVVLKPSEETPKVGQLIGKCMESAGLPEDVFSLVLGAVESGKNLVASSVDKIVFTGSVPTGKMIAIECAKTLKPVSLELGGKDPMLILADAPLEHTINGALWGSFVNSGQCCASVERIVIHESIFEEFCRQFLAKIETLRQSPDNNLDKNTDLGRITAEKQKEVYRSQLADVNPENILCGGEFTDNDKALKPTVILCEGSEKVWNEESFGPIVCLRKFKKLDEGIAICNASNFGLLASVWTSDTKKGLTVSKQLEAGTVIINDCVYTHGLPETPWSGIKNSGYGSPIHGEEGLMSSVKMKHIHYDRFGKQLFKPLWWFPYSEKKYELFKDLARLVNDKKGEMLNAGIGVLNKAVSIIRQKY